MEYIIEYLSTNKNSIISAIIIPTLSTIVLGLGGYFRKGIFAIILHVWLRGRLIYKKIRRFRFSQSLPSHTLEYIRLKRRLRELDHYNQKKREQNEELEKNIITMLTWSSKFRYFRKDDVLNAMSWKRSYTHMILGLAIKRELIKPIDNQRALFFVTTEGRELLFHKGLLCA